MQIKRRKAVAIHYDEEQQEFYSEICTSENWLCGLSPIGGIFCEADMIVRLKSPALITADKTLFVKNSSRKS
jgi:hypothetical protein